MKQLFLYLFIITIGSMQFSCSPKPYKATNKVYKKQVKEYARRLAKYPLTDSVFNAPYFAGTTNLSMRKPNYVIIHHTAQNSCDQTLKTFTLPRTQVSAHYVICKNGTVFHMLNDYLRAHHAGISKWGNTTDINSSSIGIELDNNGFENFDERQLQSLTVLLQQLKKAYAIPAANFIGHGDIAPTRKNDPNWRFPWKQLSENGFGNWYEDTTGIQMPAYFSPLQALRTIGYDTKDSAAAMHSFKRHWLQDSATGATAAQLKVLYMVSRKYF
ncbi:MAG: hypothetical protein RLZZ316_2521 [Bacteroidota bacterium]|jgi:N-acetylmuramoyl-L-alanine amidase